MLGGSLALLAAMTFAFSNVSSRRGVITGTVLQGLAITAPMGLPLFLMGVFIAGATEALFGFTTGQILSLSAAGLCHFVLARYCSYRAIRALGSNLSAPVQRLSLPIALGLALWLLGEYLTLLRLIGIALVIAGPAVMLTGQVAARRSPKRSATTGGFEPQYVEGYLFAFLSAAGYGASPLFVRSALEGSGITTALAGGVYSYAAATLVLSPLYFTSSTRRAIFAIHGETARWFLAAGVLTSVSQMMRYMAFALAPVTVVASIMVSSLVFRFLFSRLFNREYEVFGVWVVVGILLTIAGSLALALHTDVILSLLPRSDWLKDAASWRWPAQ